LNLGGIMWKSFNTYSEPARTAPIRTRHPRKEGGLIASVGESRESKIEIEGIYKIDNDILGYNLDSKRVLLRVPQNEREFDIYVSMPFTKGATERRTGRTLLIIGSGQHHIEAMDGQFSGLIWTADDRDETRKYGDTIRWINVGDTRNGFIGLDYNPQAKATEGVAISEKEVSFLAKILLEAGYDSQKRLFLLKPPFIQEQEAGKALRKKGMEKLADWAKRK